MIAIYSSIVAGALSFLFVPLIRKIAFRFRVLDDPLIAREKKIHGERIPLMGGVAIFFAFFLSVFFLYFIGIDFGASGITLKHLVGMGIASALLMIGGFFDDRYRLTPSQQILWPILAAIVVIASGIGITYITSPFGGPLGTEQLRLDGYEKILFWFRGVPYKFTLFADFFTFVWLLGMMYTTKFLDGLDGLVAGVTTIGALIVAVLALDPVSDERGTALLAFILAGAFVGFLLWNWHPAKIFLGEGGSLFAGFMLGVLSIISGSKVATTALVLAIPICDVAWVIVRRLFFERRSPLRGDKTHLHFRLLSLGFSHRKAVCALYCLTAYFGITALFLQSKGRFFAFLFLGSGVIIVGAGVVFVRWIKR